MTKPFAYEYKMYDRHLDKVDAEFVRSHFQFETIQQAVEHARKHAARVRAIVVSRVVDRSDPSHVIYTDIENRLTPKQAEERKIYTTNYDPPELVEARKRVAAERKMWDDHKAQVERRQAESAKRFGEAFKRIREKAKRPSGAYAASISDGPATSGEAHYREFDVEQREAAALNFTKVWTYVTRKGAYDAVMDYAARLPTYEWRIVERLGGVQVAIFNYGAEKPDAYAVLIEPVAFNRNRETWRDTPAPREYKPSDADNADQWPTGDAVIKGPTTSRFPPTNYDPPELVAARAKLYARDAETARTFDIVDAKGNPLTFFDPCGNKIVPGDPDYQEQLSGFMKLPPIEKLVPRNLGTAEAVKQLNDALYALDYPHLFNKARSHVVAALIALAPKSV